MIFVGTVVIGTLSVGAFITRVLAVRAFAVGTFVRKFGILCRITLFDVLLLAVVSALGRCGIAAAKRTGGNGNG